MKKLSIKILNLHIKSVSYHNGDIDYDEIKYYIKTNVTNIHGLEKETFLVFETSPYCQWINSTLNNIKREYFDMYETYIEKIELTDLTPEDKKNLISQIELGIKGEKRVIRDSERKIRLMNNLKKQI